VLLAVGKSGKTLAELRQEMSKLPQTMINVRVETRFDPFSRDDIVAAVQLAEEELGGSGRILLRASGTEPLIRVMAEGQNADDIRRVVKRLAQVVENSTP
jgi:phosphoglucosamine mutase